MNRAASGSPWYYHFWPWFILILLGLSVAGSLATVYIAHLHRDSEVGLPASTESSKHAPEYRDGG